MKIIFFVFFFTVNIVFAEENPFVDDYEGMPPPVTARWEKLLVDDSHFDNKVIFIDGFISVQKYGKDGFRYYLFIDSESLKYSRTERYIFIDSKLIDSVLSQKHGLNSDDKIKLIGKYVKILGIYKKPKSDNLAMRITGPLTIHFLEGNIGPVNILKD